MYVLPTGPATTRNQADAIQRTPEAPLGAHIHVGRSLAKEPTSPPLCQRWTQLLPEPGCCSPGGLWGWRFQLRGIKPACLFSSKPSRKRTYRLCGKGASVGKYNTVLLQRTQPLLPSPRSPQNRTHGHRAPPVRYLELYHFILQCSHRGDAGRRGRCMALPSRGTSCWASVSSLAIFQLLCPPPAPTAWKPAWETSAILTVSCVLSIKCRNNNFTAA